MNSLPAIVFLSISEVISPQTNRSILNVIPQLVFMMNEQGLSDFSTDKIEYVATIEGKQGEEYLYIDFDGINGFMLFDNNRLIFWKDDIDIPVIRSREGDVFFSNYTFKNEFGNPLITLNNSNNDYSDLVYYNPGTIATQYNFPIEYNNIESLLSTKYSGYSWELEACGKLPGLNSTVNSEGYRQFEESIYKVYENNTWNGEGNCGIVSISNAFQYYSHYSPYGLYYSLLPSYSSTTSISPSLDEPSIMAQAAAQSPSYIPISDPRTIHRIPAVVRSKAIEMGYVTGGMDDTKTSYAFSQSAMQWGYYGYFQAYASLSVSQLIDEIDSGYPLQFRTGGDVLYDDHGMMVTGYRFYTAEKLIQINPNLTIIAYLSIPFLSVYDGHSHNERWYDLTSYGNMSSSYSRADSQTFATLHLEVPE